MESCCDKYNGDSNFTYPLFIIDTSGKHKYCVLSHYKDASKDSGFLRYSCVEMHLLSLSRHFFCAKAQCPGCHGASIKYPPQVGAVRMTPRKSAQC